MEINILMINYQILNLIKKEEEKNLEKIKILNSMISFYDNQEDSFVQNLIDVKKKIHDESISLKSEYIIETLSIISEYLSILKKPILHEEKKTYQKKKDLLLTKFLIIVKKYAFKKKWDIVIPTIKPEKIENMTCEKCKNNDIYQFQIEENKKTCLECSFQSFDFGNNFNTLDDYKRIKIITKFMYNRILHFEFCIKQYQGKQNYVIPDFVYSELEKKFIQYRLINPSETNKYSKYSKITKQHIYLFLKELKFNKQYENVNLIYYVLTGKRNDISHLEEKIIQDFKELIKMYDSLSMNKKIVTNRKNFLNIQYVLFQLLRKYNYPCKKEEFFFLKTLDRKISHDYLCKQIFDILKWKFTPTF